MTSVLIPQEIVNDESVTILQWKVPSGAAVQAGQVLAELETSKTAFDVPSPRAGYVHYTLAPGAEAAIGSLLCYITDSAEKPSQVESGPAPAAAPNGNGQAEAYKRTAGEPAVDPSPMFQPAAAPDRTTEFSATRFSKKAATLLAQHNLDPAMFQSRGLVREDDIRRAIGGSAPGAAAPVEPAAAPARAAAGPVGAAGVPIRTEALSRAKRTEIKYLASGSANALTSVVSVSVPTRGLRAAVEKLGAVGANASTVIAYETSRLLKKYPLFNAYYHDGQANLYEQINLGFAVDAGKGLKVPVVRQIDTKTIAQVADEMGELVQSYLADTLPVETLAGGTFTLTDLSGEGVTYFHPLINRGQAAILGVCAEYFPPGAKEGVFNLILAFDHQLSDGRTAGKFLGELADRLRAYERAGENRSAPARQPAEMQCTNCGRELSLHDKENRFLIPVILPDGSNGRLCVICFDGWT